MKRKLLIGCFLTILSTSYAQRTLQSTTFYVYDTGGTTISNVDSIAYSYSSGMGSLSKLKPELTFIEGYYIPEIPEFTVPSDTEKVYSGLPSALTFLSQKNNVFSGNNLVSSTDANGSDRTIYTYNSNGNKTSEVNQFLNGSIWETSDSLSIVYNANNKPTSSSRYFVFGGFAAQLEYTDSSFYNPSNGLIEEYVSYFFDSSTGTLTLSEKNEYQYISNQIDIIDSYEPSGTPGVLDWYLRLKYLYTGSSLNQVDALNIIGGTFPSPIPFISLFLEYNTQNNISAVHEILLGDTVSKTLYDYKDVNFINKATAFESDGMNLLKNAETTFHYFDVLGIDAEKLFQNISVYPNPTTSTIKLEGVENLQSVQILNLSGQILLNQTNPTIDVRHLPAGAYLIMGKAENGTFKKTFIKQ